VAIKTGRFSARKKLASLWEHALGYSLELYLFPMQLSREQQFSALYCLVAIEELLLKRINRREFVAATAAAGATVFASRHAFALQG